MKQLTEQQKKEYAELSDVFKKLSEIFADVDKHLLNDTITYSSKPKKEDIELGADIHRPCLDIISIGNYIIHVEKPHNKAYVKIDLGGN